MCAMDDLLTIGAVTKDKRNEAVGKGYGYASDEAVTAAFRKVMQKSGLHVKSCEIARCDLGEVETKSGTFTTCTVVVRFFFADDSREYGPFEGVGSGMDRGDKAPMKALTAARKYALSQAALISWGDDPEGDPKTDEAAKTRKPSVPANGNGKPENAELFMSLLVESAKQGTESLQQAWAWESAENQDVARSCRRYVASLDGGHWWDELKQQAAQS